MKLTNEEYMAMANKLTESVQGDELVKVLNDLPTGETITGSVTHEGKTKTYSYTQKAIASLLILHGISIDEEVKKLAVEELKLSEKLSNTTA